MHHTFSCINTFCSNNSVFSSHNAPLDQHATTEDGQSGDYGDAFADYGDINYEDFIESKKVAYKVTPV